MNQFSNHRQTEQWMLSRLRLEFLLNPEPEIDGLPNFDPQLGDLVL
jgi:hypothetical protein